jgi:hypothetical protein
MKKILIELVVVLLILVALWNFNEFRNKDDYKKDNNSLKESERNYDCDDELGRIQGDTPQEQGEWLGLNIKNPSDEFCKCVAGRHKISKETFYEDVEKAWKKRSFWAHLNPFFKKYTAITCNDIIKMYPCQETDQNGQKIPRPCYDSFLGFGEGKYFNTITLKSMPKFVNSETCYSFPLMHGVHLTNGLDNGDVIDFAEAIGQNNQSYIYFRVKNKNTGDYSFYDISDDPGKGFLPLYPSPY